MIVDPGFDYSTLAIAEAYCDAFETLGFDIVEYDLKKSIDIARIGIGKEANYHSITEMACSPIVNQVINDKIDVVLMIHGFWMNPSIVVSLREIGCKTGLILTDEPMQTDRALEWSRYFEYVFTNDRNTLNSFGKRGHYLPVAVNHNIFKEQEVLERHKSDILIGGSFYKERIEFLENPVVYQFLNLYDTSFVGSRKLDFENPGLNKFVKANKISYEEMAKYVSGTKLSIDIPRNEFNCKVFGESNKNKVKASCLSPRIFECIASRSLFLTSNVRKDICDLFPDISFPVYGNEEECVELAKLLLDPNELIEWKKFYYGDIYDYTLKNHTYENRTKKIMEVMNLRPTIKDLRNDGVVNVLVNKRWDDQWTNNFSVCVKNGWYTQLRNLDYLKDLPNKYGNTVDIISNGPSLEASYIKLCQENRYNQKVRLYLNNAIRFKNNCGYNEGTTYSLAIHPNDDVYERCFRDIDIDGIDLICSTLACPKVIEKFVSTNFGVYFFNTGNEGGIKKQVYEQTKYPVLNPGLTVGFSALSVAVYLGFKHIHIYGLDFCYKGNKKYAFESEVQLASLDKKMITLVEDAKGRPVISDQVMIKSRDITLKFIEEHPDVTFSVYGEGLLYSSKLPNLKVL